MRDVILGSARELEEVDKEEAYAEAEEICAYSERTFDRNRGTLGIAS